MASKKGLLVICDRCGTTCFREYAGQGVTDGGYTTWDKFQPAPEGWDSHNDTGTLCPECNAQYLRMIEKFKQRVEVTLDD